VSKDEMSKLGVFACLGLESQDHPSFNACLSRLAVKPPDDSEDKSADFREQSAIVSEIGPQ